VLAAILVLGRPLGQLLFEPPRTSGFWPSLVGPLLRPEPTEHARYLLALLGPILLAGVIVISTGRRVPAALVRPLVACSQAALAAVVLASLLYQRRHIYEIAYFDPPSRTVYFTSATLTAATLLGLLAALALSSEQLLTRITRAVRDTPTKRVIALAGAALFVVPWLLAAYNSDGTIDLANPEVRANIPFWIDEAVAVLNGHPPLVDFHAQYGQLWAYLAAGGMALLGTSLGAYSLVMLAGTAAALSAVFATFRRVAGSSLAALGLFLPFVATSFFVVEGPLDNRFGPANLYSVFPIRYAGPFLLLWLVARRSGPRAARQPLGLLVLAGLVLVNNVEFGLPAFGATLGALIWLEPQLTVRFFARLAIVALAALATAAAIVAALTLITAGSLPHFGLLATFPKIYGVEGYGLLPIPAVGVHLLLYITLAAAIALATVRATGGRRDALTGALAWTGLFGLGAGAYFAGRSHPHVLIDLFSPWALALGLLVVVLVQDRQRGHRRPGMAELLVLIGFGLMVCSLAQTPTPWSQVERLSHANPASAQLLTVTESFVDQLTHEGEPVALLMWQGHRIAHDLGLDDVMPYTNLELMLTRPQWQETIAALRRAHGTKVIVPRRGLLPEETEWLQQAGYQPGRETSYLGLVELVATGGGG
jgi:hypothetical protein